MLNTTPTNVWNYDPGPICVDQAPPLCENKIFKVFTQAGPREYNGEEYKGDYIRSYIYNLNLNPPEWSQPNDEVYTNGYYPCYDEDNENDDNFKYDTFASPDGIRTETGTLLFYSHGSADGYNGSIEYKYIPANGSLPITKKLLGISPCNISACTCCGGVARVAALKDGNYFYIYFEVWIGVSYEYKQNEQKKWICETDYNKSLNITCPEKMLDNQGNGHCWTVTECKEDPKSNTFLTEQSIGHNYIFLVKVEVDSNGLPKIASGSGKIWRDSTKDWGNLSLRSEHFLCGNVSFPFDAQTMDYYVFSWKNSDSDELYCISGDNCIDYFQDNIFKYSQNVHGVSLGDVFKNSEGKYIAIINGSDDNLRSNVADDPAFSSNFFHSVIDTSLISILSKCSHPSIYEDGKDGNGNIKYKFFYSDMPGNEGCQWSNAVIRTAEMVKKFIKVKPAPVIIKNPFFLDIFNNFDIQPRIYYDSNNDGILDEEINISLKDLKYFKGINNYISAIQEDGYAILYIYTGCSYKKNGKIKCTNKDFEKLPEIDIDEDNGVLKILDSDLSIGDEFLLKIIMRPYDPEEDKSNEKKDKKCKKEDKCIDLKIKIVE